MRWWWFWRGVRVEGEWALKKEEKKTEIENTYRAQEQINEADSKQGGFKKERGERAGREKP